LVQIDLIYFNCEQRSRSSRSQPQTTIDNDEGKSHFFYPSRKLDVRLLVLLEPYLKFS